MVTAFDKDKIFNVSLLLNLSHKDAEIVEKIFDETADPHFIITKKIVSPLGIDYLVQLEIFAESTLSLWQLAKQVEFKQCQERFRPERIKSIQYDILMNKYAADKL